MNSSCLSTQYSRGKRVTSVFLPPSSSGAVPCKHHTGMCPSYILVVPNIQSSRLLSSPSLSLPLTLSPPFPNCLPEQSSSILVYLLWRLSFIHNNMSCREMFSEVEAVLKTFTAIFFTVLSCCEIANMSTSSSSYCL